MTGKTASPQSHHVGVTSWRSRSLREDVSVGGSLVLERVSLGAFQRVRPRARLRLHDTRVVVVVVVVHQSRRSLRCRVRLPGDSRDARRERPGHASSSPDASPRSTSSALASLAPPEIASLARAASRSCRTTRRRPPGDAASSPRGRRQSSSRVRPHLERWENRFRTFKVMHLDPMAEERRRLTERRVREQTSAIEDIQETVQRARHARSRRTGHQTHAPTVDATPPRRAPASHALRRQSGGAIRRRVDGWTPSPRNRNLPRLLRNRRRGGDRTAPRLRTRTRDAIGRRRAAGE